jgi:hypothetical protein
MNYANCWVKKLTLFILFSFLSTYSNNSYASPIAKITGPDAVLTGEIISLNGISSSGKSLKYHWRIIDAPKGSRSQLINPTNARVSFTATHVGKYQIELRVLEDKVWSSAKNISVSSIIGAGSIVLNSDNFTTSFTCKLTLGYYGCKDVIRNFTLNEVSGNYSIVVENNGIKKAFISIVVFNNKLSSL